MSTATTATVQTVTREDGNLVRMWQDDTVWHVQLTTPVMVELAMAKFTGRDARKMAALVAATLDGSGF
jgi:hypothetical protein